MGANESEILFVMLRLNSRQGELNNVENLRYIFSAKLELGVAFSLVFYSLFLAVMTVYVGFKAIPLLFGPSFGLLYLSTGLCLDLLKETLGLPSHF